MNKKFLNKTYCNEITFPVLVASKETNNHKDNMKKVGCNR